MACPLNATTGFQILQGQIDTGVLTSIREETYPGIISFSPRQVPPTLVGGTIDESTANTIQIKGITYKLTSTQICNPTHKTFTLPGAKNVPVLDLVLTFYVKTKSTSANYANMVLMILPIYESNQESYSAYLNQLLDTTLPAANLQTLFYASPTDTSAKSIQYSMCIDIVNGATKSNLNTLVLYFPRGCTVTQQHSALLKSNNVTDYRVPPVILEPWETVMSYTIQPDGTKVPSNMSREGYIPTTQIAIDSFKKICQYLTQPPKLPSQYNSNVSPSYTNQFQCVPLDQVTVSGEQVIFDSGTGPTMDKKLKMMDEIRQGELASGVITVDVILYIMAAIFGVLLLGGLLIWFFTYLSAIDDETYAILQAARTARTGSTAAPRIPE
jgi:hypothetical protein